MINQKAMSKKHYKKSSEHQWEDLHYFLEHPIEYEVFQKEYLYRKCVGIRSKDSFSLGGNPGRRRGFRFAIKQRRIKAV